MRQTSFTIEAIPSLSRPGMVAFRVTSMDLMDGKWMNINEVMATYIPMDVEDLSDEEIDLTAANFAARASRLIMEHIHQGKLPSVR